MSAADSWEERDGCGAAGDDCSSSASADSVSEAAAFNCEAELAAHIPRRIRNRLALEHSSRVKELERQMMPQLSKGSQSQRDLANAALHERLHALNLRHADALQKAATAASMQPPQAIVGSHCGSDAVSFVPRRVRVADKKREKSSAKRASYFSRRIYKELNALHRRFHGESSCRTPACTPPIRCICAACQDGGAISRPLLACDMCSCACVYQKQDAQPVPCPTHEICIPDSEFSAITKMIEYSGADLEQVVDKGTTLLIAAAELGMRVILTALLRAGARADAADALQRCAVVIAASRNHSACVDAILEHVGRVRQLVLADDVEACTQFAISYGNPRIARSVIQYVKTCSSFDMSRFLDRALIASAAAADAALLQLFLEEGASANAVDSLRRSALMHAVASKVARFRCPLHESHGHCACRIQGLTCVFGCC